MTGGDRLKYLNVTLNDTIDSKLKLRLSASICSPNWQLCPIGDASFHCQGKCHRISGPNDETIKACFHHISAPGHISRDHWQSSRRCFEQDPWHPFTINARENKTVGCCHQFTNIQPRTH